MRDASVMGQKSGLVAAAVCAIAGLASVGSASAAVAEATPTFLSSLGINAHVSLNQGPYQDVFALTGKLSYLGINHVRDDVRNTTSSVARYLTLGATGNKLTLMLSPGAIPTPTTALVAFTPLASYIDTIEGANEINVTPPSYGGYTGVAAAQAYQKAIYAADRGNTHFATTAKVAQFTYGPVVYNPEGAGLADVSNVHLYPLSKAAPYYTLAVAYKTLLVPTHKVYITEFNYPTSHDAGKGVPEDIQAKYLLDGIFDATMLGFVRTYIYEVIDEGTDITNQEDNFGLFRYDGSAKPSAFAIHNLLQILGTGVTNPPQSFAPASLSYSISESLSLEYMDANLFHYLLQGPNGTFYLVLWAEPPLYNVAELSPHPVTISFPSAHTSVQVFDPLVGTSATNSFSNTKSVNVTTVDHPIILAISNN